MWGITGYFGFLASSIMLNMVPGADTIYILSKAITGGKKKGIVSALGISTGILIHTVLASLGLSAILASSALAFNLMKLAGAAYLIVMGLRTIFSTKELLPTGEMEEEDTESVWKIYRQGVLTNALNPKVALFFLSLLPQFVSADNGYGPLPFLLLGLSFFATSTVWSVFVAFLSSLLSRVLRSNERISKWMSKISGGIYILLGIHVLRAKLE